MSSVTIPVSARKMDLSFAQITYQQRRVARFIYMLLLMSASSCGLFGAIIKYYPYHHYNALVITMGFAILLSIAVAIDSVYRLTILDRMVVIRYMSKISNLLVSILGISLISQAIGLIPFISELNTTQLSLWIALNVVAYISIGYFLFLMIRCVICSIQNYRLEKSTGQLLRYERV